MKILLLKENDAWIAQCLDVDINAQGKTKQEAMENLEKEFRSYIYLSKKYETKPFNGIGKAPDYYFKLYEGTEKRT